MAHHLVVRSVHHHFRVNRDREGHRSANAVLTVVRVGRGDRDRCRLSLCRRVRQRQSADVARTRSRQTADITTIVARIGGRPCIGHRTVCNCCREFNFHDGRVVANHLVGRSIHHHGRVNRDLLSLCSGVAAQVGQGPLTCEHAGSQIAGRHRILVHISHHKVGSSRTVVAIGSRIGFTSNRHTCIECTVRSTADGDISRHSEVRLLIIHHGEFLGIRSCTILGIRHINLHGVFVTAVVGTCHSHRRAGCIYIRCIFRPSVCVAGVTTGNRHADRIGSLVRASRSRYGKSSHQRIGFINSEGCGCLGTECIGYRYIISTLVQARENERRIRRTTVSSRACHRIGVLRITRFTTGNRNGNITVTISIAGNRNNIIRCRDNHLRIDNQLTVHNREFHIAEVGIVVLEVIRNNAHRISANGGFGNRLMGIRSYEAEIRFVVQRAADARYVVTRHGLGRSVIVIFCRVFGNHNLHILKRSDGQRTINRCYTIIRSGSTCVECIIESVVVGSSLAHIRNGVEIAVGSALARNKAVTRNINRLIRQWITIIRLAGVSGSKGDVAAGNGKFSVRCRYSIATFVNHIGGTVHNGIAGNFIGNIAFSCMGNVTADIHCEHIASIGEGVC